MLYKKLDFLSTVMANAGRMVNLLQEAITLAQSAGSSTAATPTPQRSRQVAGKNYVIILI